jgi:S-adenosylmethionine:tRNA ribosyltransferase-isomerase
MLATEFDYHLPPELIAQKPTSPRDSSRLMAVNRHKKTVEEKVFRDIADYLQKGDLVWNNSKVFKAARLFGKLMTCNDEKLWEHKRNVEIFLVRPMENEGVWKVLAKPGRHARNGLRVEFAPDFYCDVIVKEPDGTILVQFPDSEEAVRAKANKYGHIPVPPYIKDEPHELESYQTVYSGPEGSVAAPTAGFHFTPELIQKLKNKGVEFAEVTLHVGLGTFLPVKAERIEDHTMHSEWVELSEEATEKINFAKSEGRRVIAVGTTTVRTLEGVALTHAGTNGTVVCPYKGDINIFIRPGFVFRVVDALVTNFHLPKSTLLMLVSAFALDKSFVLNCYEKAVRDEYRFFSFGDAMFLY